MSRTEAKLYVGTSIYGGWQRLSVTRSIEQIANGFELEVTERWPGQSTSRPIRPGEKCTLKLGDETVITGYVDDAEPAYDKEARSLSIRGRDATGYLVDCSAIHKAGQWANTPLDRIASGVCAPFGIKVKVETDVGKPFHSYGIDPGETVFDCIERAARQRAVLLISDGDGNLVITRAGNERAGTALIEGQNILHAQGRFSWKDRYSIIKVLGQERANDYFYGEHAAGASASIKDDAITNYRPLIVHAESHGAGATLRDRATWERNVRMGRGNRGTITVQGWTDGDGKLWQPNTLVTVDSSFLYLRNAEMLIVGCLHTLDSGGSRTALSIVQPEAFDLINGVGSSSLFKKLNAKEQKEKRSQADDSWGAW